MPAAQHFGQITAQDRARSSIPARFETWEAYRDYMREYVASWRTRKRGSAPRPTVDDGTPAAIAAARERSTAERYRRPGFCALCGHEYPLDTCPICADELAGLHAEPGPAWEALIRVIA